MKIEIKENELRDILRALDHSLSAAVKLRSNCADGKGSYWSAEIRRMRALVVKLETSK